MGQFILDSFFVLLVAIAGRLNDDQQRVIDYVVTENRILREMLEGRGGRLRMEQLARNPTDAFDGSLVGKWYLIHDRDPLFTREFRDILSATGVNSVRLPPRSPNLNPHAERFVLSIKSECLNRLILTSEAQLRRSVHSYLAHYHGERPHQGLGNRLISGVTAAHSDGDLVCPERLGGLLRYYHREAA
jgi:transposase InsO family protein